MRGIRTSLMLALLAAAPLAAQHGHPLAGSWSGDWGQTPEERTRLLVTLEFSAEQVISGTIFERGQRIPIASATLDPATWTVRLTAEREDAGRAVRYIIEGRVENLGSATERAIAGSWIEGEARGDFRIVRN